VTLVLRQVMWLSGNMQLCCVGGGGCVAGSVRRSDTTAVMSHVSALG
jgi:hypothetical protein